MTRMRRLRPSQGGKFLGPVAATRLWIPESGEYTHRARDPVPKPAAPPVDAELERERARLVGKRVRHATTQSLIAHVESVDNVVRDDRGVMLAEDYALRGRYPSWALEPIPDEKPRETTFGELAVGEWFVLAFADNWTAQDSVPRQKISASEYMAPFGTCGGYPSSRVRRIDPPKGGAA